MDMWTGFGHVSYLAEDRVEEKSRERRREERMKWTLIYL